MCIIMLAYNPFLLEGLNWGEDFFRSVTNSDSCLHDLNPNDETQILGLFSGFDDTPPILYHGLELINIDLLSITLPWLNTNNLKYK